METEHTARLREEARRLKSQQEKELRALKMDPKEVISHPKQDKQTIGWKVCSSMFVETLIELVYAAT